MSRNETGHFPNRHPSRRLALGLMGLALAAPGLLAACGAVEAPPKDTFYRLDVDPATVIGAARTRPETLEVARFDAVGLLAERPVVYTAQGATLEQYFNHFWIEAPPELLQRHMVEFLRSNMAFAQVVTPALRTRPDLELRGTILRLEQTRPTEQTAGVAVSLELSLIDVLTGDVKMLATYTETGPAADTSVAAAVQAIRDALGRIEKRFLADLINT